MAAPRKTPRKAAAKKANSPMKNAPKAKSPRTAEKADAKKAARSMAKMVNPGIRKSAAKRVEKGVNQAVGAPLAKQLEQGGFAAVKKHANQLIAVLRNDAALVAAGTGNEAQYRQLVLAVSRAIDATKKKQSAQ